ncbi:MAG: alpha/beta fold hydrolase, partial [Phenylobacterium sp.]
TVTPPGYEMSTQGQVEVIDQLTRKLDLPSFVLAGNSMGGGASWNYALAHPDRLRGLVLVASVGPRPAAGTGAARREGPPAIFQGMATPIGRAALRSLDPRPLAEPGLKKAYVDESLVTPALVDRYVELARAPGRREMILAGRRGPPSASPDAVRGVSGPTLVMHGAKDTVVPVGVGEELNRLIPGAQLIVYPEAGHVPMEQIPDRSAADVRSFIESLPATQTPEK